MKFSDELSAVSEAIASSAKLSVGVSAATASLGIASAADFISGPLSSIAMGMGIIATVLVIRIHLQVHKNHVVQNKIYRRQLISMGGDPDADEDK